ncbi:MAG: hypothetical protein JTJ26_00785 [Prevotella sp.]|nr:hypothetical protein [Prevotella sp.]
MIVTKIEAFKLFTHSSPTLHLLFTLIAPGGEERVKSGEESERLFSA